MNWLSQLLTEPSAMQASIIFCFICAVGLALSNIRFRGISLGITYVFFMGILVGAIGIKVDPQMLSYAESFGLVLFVYALGLQVGPGFMSSVREGGTQLNLLAVGVVLSGTFIALVSGWLGILPLQDMMGVLCGATTNTPALGAAQQTLKELGMPSSGAALSCAVTYPLGLVGVIIALLLVKGWLLRHEKPEESNTGNEPFIASFKVTQPKFTGHTLAELHELDESRFVISRVWRGGKAILPTASTRLEMGDRVLVITKQKEVRHLAECFGEQDNTNWNKKDVDWNAIDSNMISRRILITRRNINGRHLGSLTLRNRYGVNVTRVKRSGIVLMATPDLTLRMGDRVTVVGEEKSIECVANELGNMVKSLDTPNMVTIFTGIVLGLLLGSIPIFIPGMSIPVKLGLAGGPIIMGILIGAYGPKFHMIAYTTTSANLMLRSLGLSMYLGCLGLDAGRDFVATVMQPAALWWVGAAIVFTMIPVMLFAFISVIVFKRSYGTTAGMLCGAMANPIALDYVNDSMPGDKASIAYATVYPLCMFLRVIVAQIIVMMWI